jgi:hypothetical protein
MPPTRPLPTSAGPLSARDAAQVGAQSTTRFEIHGVRRVSLDPTENGTRADVHVRGARVVSSLDAGATAASERAHIDGRDLSLVPLMDRTVLDQHGPHSRAEGTFACGAPADLVLVRGSVSLDEALRLFVVRPHDLAFVMLRGRVVALNGQPWCPPRPSPTEVEAVTGTWIDTSGYLHQHLLPNGRYTETRGGREDAYTGHYWTYERRIVYLDDSGFWAFGQFRTGVLHHAGYVMTRGSDSEPSPRPGTMPPTPRSRS